MKSINKLVALLLIVVAILSACTKEMGVFEFVATPKPPAPPVRVPEVDPDDVLAAKITYLGETYNTQVMGSTNTMTIQLKDKDFIRIALPLQGDTLVRAGKYILRNSQPVTDTLAPLSIYADIVSKSNIITYNVVPPSLDYDITLEMEIDTMNRETHTLTGFIDTLRAVHKTDPTKNFELSGEFSFQWNYYGIEVDGVLQGEYYLGQDITNKHPNGGWAPGEMPIIEDRSANLITGTYFQWSAYFWNQANIDLFNANKGVGEYQRIYDNVNFVIDDASAILYYQGTLNQYFSSSDTCKVVFKNFNAGQFVEGYFYFIARELDATTFANFIANSQPRRFKISFAYRKILY